MWGWHRLSFTPLLDAMNLKKSAYDFCKGSQSHTHTPEHIYKHENIKNHFSYNLNIKHRDGKDFCMWKQNPQDTNGFPMNWMLSGQWRKPAKRTAIMNEFREIQDVEGRARKGLRVNPFLGNKRVLWVDVIYPRRSWSMTEFSLKSVGQKGFFAWFAC